jgi:hypothetical protein
MDELETEAEARELNAAIDRGLAGVRWAELYRGAGTTEVDDSVHDLDDGPGAQVPDDDDVDAAFAACPAACVRAYGGALGMTAKLRVTNVRLAVDMAIAARRARDASHRCRVCAGALARGRLLRPSTQQLAIADDESRRAYLAASEEYGRVYRQHRLRLVRALASEEHRRLEERYAREMDRRVPSLDARIAAAAERYLLRVVAQHWCVVGWDDVESTRVVPRPSEQALAMGELVSRSLGLRPASSAQDGAQRLEWATDEDTVPVELTLSVVEAKLVDSSRWREAVALEGVIGEDPGGVRLAVLVLPLEEVES